MDFSSDFIERISNLFEQQYGYAPTKIERLTASGSDRKYVRLWNKNNKSLIGVYNPDRPENNTFFYFTDVFEKAGMAVPKILARGAEKETYLLEDLGAKTLYDIIKAEGESDYVKMLLQKSVDQLVRFHWQVGNHIDYSLCYASQQFDDKQILADLLYFKYYFADPLQIKYNKGALIDELTEWSKHLAAEMPQTFMYRDFQSRNIMVAGEEISFIDYQGGMLGQPAYDLASLLWQARAGFSDSLKAEMLNYYFRALENIPEKPKFDELQFRKTYFQCVLLRMLQTLGAYGFRGLIQKKELFLNSISPALKQLKGFLTEYPQYPPFIELRKVLEALVQPDITRRFQPVNYAPEQLEKLKIAIYSFSYKKGIPADYSGNGGGYVFDCRGILNPGRQDEFKRLTGKDKPVIDFLEQKTKMPEFLNGVYTAVDISVVDYLERGFENLSVAFGCTGGQHRSVYAAEALARHLSAHFGISSQLTHLEQEENTVKRR